MRKGFRFKIIFKTILLAFVLAFAVVEVAMTFHTISVSRANRKNYEDKTLELSGTVAAVVDIDLYKSVYGQVKSIYEASPTKVMSDDWGSPEWEAYQAQFDPVAQSAEFNQLREFIRKIGEANSKDLSCIYFAFIDPTLEHFVYVCDSAPDEDACPPGCIDPLYDFNKEVITNPNRGFPPYTTNTPEYGYLMTAGSAIKDGSNVIGYALVDVSMGAVRQAQAQSIVRLFLYLTASVVALGVVAVVIVGFILVRPLRLLTEAASGYDKENPDSGHEAFKNLNIRNHDEVGELAYSMKKMESDINMKINELITVNEELRQTKDVAKEMTTLANKDGLNGVRNKTSYNNYVVEFDKKIASKEITEFSIAMIDLNDLKLINDNYGHSAGDAALIKLSSLICGVFTHSPVFRVGGDEFVVILTKTDFARRFKLFDELNEKLDSLSNDIDLKLSERINAALGHSDFNAKSDKSVESVFVRADRAMYERKKRMKEK